MRKAVPLVSSNICSFSELLNGFQHPPVNCCSTASCDFGVLKKGEHSSFCSTTLNQFQEFLMKINGYKTINPKPINEITQFIRILKELNKTLYVNHYEAK